MPIVNDAPTTDSIRIYLKEIGSIKLLKANEEIELARKIADLLHLENIRNDLKERLNRLPNDREWANELNMDLPQFRRRLYLGRKAKDKMVEANLRLVVSIAKKYQNRGLSFQDLIQEGSLGLIRGAEKFDPEKGYKFSTYATWWIRQGITRAIALQSRTISLPVHLHETISQAKKATKILSQKLGRKPTEEEIATRMEITVEKLRFVNDKARIPLSLETTTGRDSESKLVDFIEAEVESPDELVFNNFLREAIVLVLDTLTDRESCVIRLRYGLDDGRMKSLEEIGLQLNLSRERVRQIEAKALRRLRHPSRNSVFKEYLRA